jgi:single-stranded DNA-binding protein
MQGSKSSFIGRLAADPMLLPNNTGDKTKDRCWFRVITNRRFGDKLDAHPCLCWNNQARAVMDHCSQGKEVYVEGEAHIEARPVTDAAGTALLRADGKPLMTNYYEVGVTYISFGADSKKKQDERARAQGVVGAPAPAAQVAAPVAQVAQVTTAPVVSVEALSPQLQELVAQAAASIVAQQQAAPASEAVILPEAHDPIPYGG